MYVKIAIPYGGKGEPRMYERLIGPCECAVAAKSWRYGFRKCLADKNIKGEVSIVRDRGSIRSIFPATTRPLDIYTQMLAEVRKHYAIAE